MDEELSPVLVEHWLTFCARMPPLLGWPSVGYDVYCLLQPAVLAPSPPAPM
jgi:hypothetical protein